MTTTLRTPLTLLLAAASAAFIVFGGDSGLAAASPALPARPTTALETTMTATPSLTALLRDALRWLNTPRHATTSLHELDARTLADIGVHPSEIGSIDAEWRGLSTITRRRIAAGAA